MSISEEDLTMKYMDFGFRAVYHEFCVIPFDKRFKQLVKHFPNIKKANCLLTYGYIDRKAGVTLEILAGGRKEGDSFEFFDPDDTSSVKLRIGSVEEEEIDIIDGDVRLRQRYNEKIEMLRAYDASAIVEKAREITVLDAFRHPYFPDDIQVYFIKENRDVEVCWARISGLAEHYLEATLLNEPDQDFGCHVNDKIAVNLYEQENGEMFCYSNGKI